MLWCKDDVNTDSRKLIATYVKMITGSNGGGDISE
jgi:hypothetical protein